ncbi:MAG: hypothetical protein QJ16_C0007G0050 [archaeon GW2011_AR1]|nr:MAG: hypothetical protein QJ16_C0007G0050 [archaeon GW2011_AR1]
MGNKIKKNEEKMSQKSKKILTLYPFNQKFPTVYESTIEFFSKNYQINYSPKKWSTFYGIKENKIIRNLYYFIMKVIRKSLKLDNLKKKLKTSPEKNFLFCFNQLPPPEFDFIIDLETIIGLTNYNYSELEKNKEYISNRLKSEKCKAIMCWTKSTSDELIKTINCSKFKNKIKVVPFAGESSKSKRENEKVLNFLFVSSINNPIAFNTKGGIIALETYVQLAKKYGNLNFFVRANIDKDLVEKYKNVPGLIFLRKYLPKDKMNDLFASSDILLVPIPGIDLFTKSMEFGIPPVCFDYGVAYDIVVDNKTGLLIDSSKIFKSKKDLKEHYLNVDKDYEILSKKEECLKFVPEFVKKSEILIKNRDLLRKMAKEQQFLVEEGGKYSLKKRNQKLIKLIGPYIK